MLEKLLEETLTRPVKSKGPYLGNLTENEKMNRLATVLLTVLILGGFGAVQFVEVGTLDFPTSGSPEAQRYFLRGVAILHSFGWKQAIAEFQAAQELEPDFAMAYWGETLSYNHPLFGEQDADSPREVLLRLGSSREERLAKAPTEREKGLLDAVETLWGEGEWRDRRVAYSATMGDLHEKYPDDDEIATFYAVSLLSAARALGDNTFRFEMRAGTIALDVFNRNPNHPGAPHYAIHSFDDPIHAPLALESAVRYAEIAPAVAHARHMPTHIFIQHGMWDMVSGHNQFAYDAARALWETGDSVGDTVHALDWGQYGDLQRGDYEKAQLWIDRLEIVTKESGGQNRASNSLPLLRARYIVETEKWKTTEITEDSPSTELLATGLSAVKTGDLETAEKAAAALKEAGSGNNQVMHKEVTASILAARGETDAAITLMDEAVEITLGMRPPNGAANPVKPTFELYGEILLGFGHYEDAIEKFETSLLRMPNRARSILGLARAHAKIGNEAAATEQYRKLVNIRGEHETLPDYKEAVGFLKEAKLKQAAKER